MNHVVKYGSTPNDYHAGQLLMDLFVSAEKTSYISKVCNFRQKIMIDFIADFGRHEDQW